MSGSPLQQSESNNATNPFPTPADSAYNPSSVPDAEVSNERKRKREEDDDDEQNADSNASRDRKDVNESFKRPRSEGTGGVETETSDINQEIASDEVSLEQIQKDMGEAFLLCRTSMPPLLHFLTSIKRFR